MSVFSSNQSTSLATTFHKHEGEKCRAYEECVREVVLLLLQLCTVMYCYLTNLLELSLHFDHGLAQMFSLLYVPH